MVYNTADFKAQLRALVISEIKDVYPDIDPTENFVMDDLLINPVANLMANVLSSAAYLEIEKNLENASAMSKEELDRIGEGNYYLERKRGTKGSTIMTMSFSDVDANITNVLSIPKGLLFTSDTGYQYVTTQTTSFYAPFDKYANKSTGLYDFRVFVQAVAAGEEYNTAASTINTVESFSQSKSLVSVVNKDAVTNATNDEDNVTYADRIRQYYISRQINTIPGYKELCKELVAEIRDVLVVGYRDPEMMRDMYPFGESSLFSIIDKRKRDDKEGFWKIKVENPEDLSFTDNSQWVKDLKAYERASTLVSILGASEFLIRVEYAGIAYPDNEEEMPGIWLNVYGVDEKETALQPDIYWSKMVYIPTGSTSSTNQPKHMGGKVDIYVRDNIIQQTSVTSDATSCTLIIPETNGEDFNISGDEDGNPFYFEITTDQGVLLGGAGHYGDANGNIGLLTASDETLTSKDGETEDGGSNKKPRIYKKLLNPIQTSDIKAGDPAQKPMNYLSLYFEIRIDRVDSVVSPDSEWLGKIKTSKFAINADDEDKGGTSLSAITFGTGETNEVRGSEAWFPITRPLSSLATNTAISSLTFIGDYSAVTDVDRANGIVISIRNAGIRYANSNDYYSVFVVENEDMPYEQGGPNFNGLHVDRIKIVPSFDKRYVGTEGEKTSAAYPFITEKTNLTVTMKQGPNERAYNFIVGPNDIDLATPLAYTDVASNIISVEVVGVRSYDWFANSPMTSVQMDLTNVGGILGTSQETCTVRLMATPLSSWVAPIPNVGTLSGSEQSTFTQVQIYYKNNATVSALRQELEINKNRNICADVLVLPAVSAPVDISMLVKLKSAFDDFKDDMRVRIRSSIEEFFDLHLMGDVMEKTDILGHLYQDPEIYPYLTWVSLSNNCPGGKEFQCHIMDTFDTPGYITPSQAVYSLNTGAVINPSYCEQSSDGTGIVLSPTAGAAATTLSDEEETDEFTRWENGVAKIDYQFASLTSSPFRITTGSTGSSILKDNRVIIRSSGALSLMESMARNTALTNIVCSFDYTCNITTDGQNNFYIFSDSDVGLTNSFIVRVTKTGVELLYYYNGEEVSLDGGFKEINWDSDKVYRFSIDGTCTGLNLQVDELDEGGMESVGVLASIACKPKNEALVGTAGTGFYMDLSGNISEIQFVDHFQIFETGTTFLSSNGTSVTVSSTDGEMEYVPVYSSGIMPIDDGEYKKLVVRMKRLPDSDDQLDGELPDIQLCLKTIGTDGKEVYTPISENLPAPANIDTEAFDNYEVPLLGDVKYPNSDEDPTVYLTYSLKNSYHISGISILYNEKAEGAEDRPWYPYNETVARTETDEDMLPLYRMEVPVLRNLTIDFQ